MRDVICKMQKLKMVEQRSAYLKDLTRHDEILYHDQKLTYSWKELSEFEKANASKLNLKKCTEGREMIFSLPQELAYDKKKLKLVVDALRIELLGNKDFELAVHKKKKYGIDNEDGIEDTNLHVHIMFSERDVNLKNTYSKDIWINPNTNKFCKPNEGILIHKKGELKKDQSNIDKWSSKDKKYKDKNFILNTRKKALQVFHEFGFNDYRIITNDSVFVKSKNWNQYSEEEYKKYVIFYNQGVKEFNNKQEEFLNKGYLIEDLMKAKNKFNKVIKSKYEENYKENDNADTYKIMGIYAETFNEVYKTPNPKMDKILDTQQKIVKHKEFYNYHNLHKLFFNERWSNEGKSLMRHIYYYQKNFIENENDLKILLDGAINDIIGFNKELKPLLGDEKFYQYAERQLLESLNDMDSVNHFNNKEIYKEDFKNHELSFYNTFKNNRELELLCERLINSLCKYDCSLTIKYIPIEELFGLNEAIDYLIREKRYEEASKLEKIKEEVME